MIIFENMKRIKIKPSYFELITTISLKPVNFLRTVWQYRNKDFNKISSIFDEKNSIV